MPIYTYVCEKGHEFDTQQSMSDKPRTKCQVQEKKYPCGAPCKKIINFRGAIRVEGGTPKFY